MDYGPAPEASEHVVAWLEEHEGRFLHFINGKFAAPAEGEFFRVVNPARGTLLAECAQGTQADVDKAVAAARKAFKSWSKLSGDARARHLYAIARILQKRARFFAVLETMDNGKPIRESRDIDIPLVARHFYHHAGWAELIESEFPGYGPVGVCGQIIPWNFPLLMLAWKIAPALAAGNTVVLKPAEFTPLTALAFAEVCVEAGLPAGVVNIVTGDGATGALIVEHEDVDKIAFTGSTEVGRIIREATAGSGKKLSLELGGKSPFIVFDDADLDSAVEGVVDAIWFNQGQVCCAGSRLIVQEAVAETDARQAEGAHGEAARRRPARQVDRHRRHRRRRAARPHQAVWWRRGGRKAITCWQPDCALAGGRFLLSADARHRRGAGLRPGAGGDFWAGARRHDVPHAGRGAGARQQLPLRARRLRLVGIDQRDARRRRAGEGRRGVGELHQPLRRGRRLRRLQGVRLRPRGRARRALRISCTRMGEEGA